MTDSTYTQHSAARYVEQPRTYWRYVVAFGLWLAVMVLLSPDPRTLLSVIPPAMFGGMALALSLRMKW